MFNFQNKKLIQDKTKPYGEQLTPDQTVGPRDDANLRRPSHQRRSHQILRVLDT